MEFNELGFKIGFTGTAAQPYPGCFFDTRELFPC